MFEIQGRVVKILPKQEGVIERGSWASQEFVIETTETQYPKKLLFKAMGKTLEYVDNLNIGDAIKVNFNAESREWKDKFFTTLTAFKITKE